MKRTITVVRLLGASILALTVACGGGNKDAAGPTTPSKPTGPTTSTGDAVTKEAQDKFNAAIDNFIAHDKANDWSDDVCHDVAKRFEDAASEQKGGKYPEATFDAGVAYQRCGNDKEAQARFNKCLADDPNFHAARAELALYKYKANQNEDEVIGELQQAVLDAKFQNIPALVNLAMFQMQRDGSNGAQGCKDDMECAKQNLQRALAIDDAYMPAFNQLALYYFQQAKKRAGTTSGKRGRSIATNAAMRKRADVQQLELAALVCSQAVKKNPNYAPIHNTAGLIQNELGQVNGAVAEFAQAAKLDPKFFEAQMNYAAVNLSFRGFEQAQGAYKRALDMRGNDYDAHLGLALALRGQINDSNYDAQVAAVQNELDTCKKLDGNRPDAYYNEGILTQEYKAKAGGDKDKVIATLNQAKTIYQMFIDKAQGKPEYDGAVKRVRGDGTDKDRGRIGDIDDTIQFLNLPGPAAPAPAAPAAPAGAAPAGGDAQPAPAGGAGTTPAPAAPATPPAH